jgi:hypothetical protein
LKTKAKVPFDRAVDRAVEALFSVFQGSNRGQFQPCFLVPSVRSAEGRGLSSFTQLPNYPFTQFCSDTVESRQFAVLLFIKELLGDLTPEAQPDCSWFLLANQERNSVR